VMRHGDPPLNKHDMGSKSADEHTFVGFDASSARPDSGIVPRTAER